MIKMVNVTAEKNPNENNASVIRRFTKKMQSTHILQQVRGRRYSSRAKSPAALKRAALKLIVRRERYQELFKLGKLPDPKTKKR